MQKFHSYIVRVHTTPRKYVMYAAIFLPESLNKNFRFLYYWEFGTWLKISFKVLKFLYLRQISFCSPLNSE